MSTLSIVIPPGVPPPKFALFQTVINKRSYCKTPLTICGMMWVNEEADWQNEDAEPGWLYAVGDASSLVSEESLAKGEINP